MPRAAGARRREIRRGAAGRVVAGATGTLRALVVALLALSLGCGTILYPERRGQSAGRLDAGVVILDAVGLLLFFVPGVVAFAVDFATGAIYLPGGRRAALEPLSDRGEVAALPLRGGDLARILARVEAETGLALDPARVRVVRLPADEDAACVEALLRGFGTNTGVTAAARGPGAPGA
jgi:hypothetical protein